MCSGRVDPQLMIDALKKADLVFVAGCHLPNDCHYKTGNHYARTRVNMMQSTLLNLGLNPDRLQMIFISPSEAKEFASAMKELTEVAINLGPNPLRLENETKIEVIDS
jgi:F420-non-reducing hydrogenase iron-sulfur subunit